MAAARQDLTDTSEKLRLAVVSFQAVGENATDLTVGMGTNAWSLSDAAARLSKTAGMAKAQAAKVLKAAEVAEAASARAAAVVKAAEKAQAAAAMAKKAANDQAKKAAKMAAQAAAAAAEAARAAEVADAAAAALGAGNMCGIFVVSVFCSCFCQDPLGQIEVVGVALVVLVLEVIVLYTCTQV